MVIETQRLILRPFRDSDADDVYEYLKEPTVNCFADRKASSPQEAADEMRRLSEETAYAFVAECRETGRVVGDIEAYPEPDPHKPDAPADTFSPCWMFAPAYQGKGYAFEAAYALFDRLFRRRIYAYTEDYNLACRRLCEKLGMRREGVFMEYVSFIDGPDGEPVWENTMQYAVLKREWLEL